MEYADGGDLQNYLKKNFSSFNWNKKHQLAFDITNGLYYLHNENIIHRDLVRYSLFTVLANCFIFLLMILLFYFSMQKI